MSVSLGCVSGVVHSAEHVIVCLALVRLSGGWMVILKI